MLCGCSKAAVMPKLSDTYCQTASVKIGDFTYSANIKYDGKCVYITPKSTNARGMTISCDGKTVTFTRRDMLKKADKSKVSQFNPAVIVYDILTASGNTERAVKSGDNYILGGKTPVGDYTLCVNGDGKLVSIKIPTAEISIDFNLK